MTEICPTFLLAIVFLCLHSSILAEQLPLKTYTVADGLASNYVNQIYQDKKGFIWFATWEGLSRFDGYNFKNFDESDGLPHVNITHINEDKEGNIWVATINGIARLNRAEIINPNNSQSPKPKFLSHKIREGSDTNTMAANQVNSILFHSDGSMWCFTNYGVFRSNNPNLAQPTFEVVMENIPASTGYLEDEDGSVWFGNGVNLMQAKGSEIINHGSIGGKYPQNLIKRIKKDAQGRYFILDTHHLFEFLPPNQDRQKGEFKTIFEVDVIFTTNTLFIDEINNIWIGATNGIIKIENGEQTTYSSDDGLAVANIMEITNDRNNSIWISLYGGGVSRLLTKSITNFIPKIQSKVVGDVFESPGQEVWGGLFDGSAILIKDGMQTFRNHYDEPSKTTSSVWFFKNNNLWYQSYHNGGTRIKKPRIQLKKGQIIEVEKYINPNHRQARFYEDEQGNIWMGTEEHQVFRGKPDENGNLVFESFPVENQFGMFNARIVSDRVGGIWLSHWTVFGRIKNGVYSPVKILDGETEIQKNIRSLFVDSRGWLWVGHRYKGVSVTQNPATENPVFTHYSKGQTLLSSNAVRSIIEDDEGRIYFGTDSGLDRFNPQTNEWTKFSVKQGLAGNAVYSLLKHSNGFIWASTESGLSQIDSRLETKQTNLPPISFTDIDIAGKDLPLPETGLAEIPKIELSPSEDDLTIGFVAPNFQDENLNYQYKLGDTDWSHPSKERSVSFSNLAGGNYRFEVRVVNQNGLVSQNPAVFEFRILPPIWQRWWFVLGALSLIGLMLYRVYRIRVNRLLEMERTRTRIATDLHDDIGTNLSKISLLSEIVKMQLADENEERTRMLQVIGETSRESVGAMSDIVWAINPNKDSLADMTRRMRQHAEEVFLEKGVSLIFNAPEDGKDIKLSMEIRRELYLIFKESVNNSAKHSDCKNVEIDFRVRQGEIFLLIKDNGRGFDLKQDANGNGLKNLHLRAERIKAELQIDSEIGKGTTISVSLKQ